MQIRTKLPDNAYISGFKVLSSIFTSFKSLYFSIVLLDELFSVLQRASYPVLVLNFQGYVLRHWIKKSQDAWLFRSCVDSMTVENSD